MANLKEIRTRISSVTNTQKVTSAMKMVSAAKLRKAQDAVTKVRPYSQKMQEIIEIVSSAASVGRFTSPLYTSNYSGKVLIILVTSNKGLCGIYNTAIVRYMLDWVESHKDTDLKYRDLEFITVGKKGFDMLSRLNYKIIDRNDELANKSNYKISEQFIYDLIQRFLKDEFCEIHIFYNRFINAASHKPMGEKLLPISVSKQEKAAQTDKAEKAERALSADFILEPNPEAILNDLTIKALEMQFHKVILDSAASEHGARMTAMHQATSNASELIYNLTLFYNKARQDAITNELLEIVSGANALKG